MAIVIVKKEPDKSVVKQIICRNCGVTLGYTPNDILQEKGKDISGCTDIYNSIDCPACNNKIYVSN